MFSALKKRLGLLKDDSAKPVSETAIGEEGKKISDEKLDEICWELELGLLESDVAQGVASEIIAGMKKELRGKRIARGHDLAKAIEASLKENVKKILSEYSVDFDSVVAGTERPTKIMFVGINGTGKTTAVAKLANMLKKKGYTVIIAAGDTFRAGAIEQLKVHGEALDVRIVSHEHGGDAAAVAYDAIEHAGARHRDFVLIDTAGRMQTNNNLMDEMKKIKRVAEPHITIFVGDALAGNDMIEQAKKFDEAVGVDMVILTKIDADAKGGSALSVTRAIRKPIVFLGTGQKYEDLMPFRPEWMAERLVS
ncbi:MAG: signal recognition particle-docking protein FtsY [Candidatus Thermoplasmatota archaeon]|jgi:fused signal recognition particle receptor|nr:signal recognition particle-docking protein FtsY [Candidatus Sysuiplasma jiujiangense]MBX8638947.1 signal recognition particle-docking protein FtsY [Candidatus Sysuiplasma jiujiangense]MBX8640993.1 signal recognition particle-docking protein FtsY [Candidatus Sysuiplasma jiujiangense]MCL4317459.1 signal recognition particle-docking protein FtsY [Candidatus Thermoplasmatota archaeon]MCL5253959.1 signal recognition particle-docking protein FtsY [Candidatus Thermoplasmatota archaeon]